MKDYSWIIPVTIGVVFIAYWCYLFYKRKIKGYSANMKDKMSQADK